MIYENILDFIGNTPMYKLKNLPENYANVFVKLEKFNLTGSIKDRAAMNMILEAEKCGALKSGGIIVEPTSGNTGIALALIGKLKGYKVIIIMPETMSVERQMQIKSYGAELILTEGSLGMSGAIEYANQMAKNNPQIFIPQQFDNPNNPSIHYFTTSEEILKDIPDLDVFVAGIGTGGTITGISKKLKEKNVNIKVYGVEPKESNVISGGKAGAHNIQGIGAGFIPKNYDKTNIDEIIQVSTYEAFEMTKKLLESEGLFLGISSGAAIFAAINLAKTLGKNKKIVVIAPDSGEKYISMEVF